MELSSLPIETFRRKAFDAVKEFSRQDADTIVKLLQDSLASKVVFNNLKSNLTKTTVAQEMAICIMVGIYLGKHVLD